MTTVLEIERAGRIITYPGKKVAFVDLDDTIYPGLLMKDLVEEQVKKDWLLTTKVDRILTAIQAYQNGQRGVASNVSELNSAWSKACEGMPYSQLRNHAFEFASTNRKQFHHYTEPVFELLKDRGYEIWLITGEPEFVAEAVVNEFYGTGYCATQWLINNQSLVIGEVINPITSQQKGRSAEQLFRPASQYSRAKAIALIDSENDIGLADAVPFSVVCGKSSSSLINHLAKHSKGYVITSPENVVRFVDKLTK